MSARLTHRVDATDGQARATTIGLARGTLATPLFMPVGTLGTVKTLDPDDIRGTGAQIILGNTYHLYLRPGAALLRDLGGLHRFMGWEGPILTDSGGFQFFSLRHLARYDDEGVTFQSHLDGGTHRFRPEDVVDIQRAIGSDIMMVLDECPPLPASQETLEAAVRRSTAWALRSLVHAGDQPNALFAIAQGGTDVALRLAHIRTLAEHAFDGLALGGLAVGEATEEREATLRAVVPEMPVDRPRYLMGVGKPQDVLAGIEAGVDLFDCVLPTRNARTGYGYTRLGRITVKQARWARDERPLDPTCGCSTCARFSRAYLSHLFRNREMLGQRLLTVHNLHYYLTLVGEARQAILEGRFAAFAAQTRALWLAREEGFAPP